MSDLSPVIVNGIGSPRAWLFTNGGEPLSDYDGQIIAKFLTKFNYTYNEEGDDECSMTLMFPTLRSFDLPYFQQDVILHVEWGYIVTDGRIIKSPRRIVAIRDLEANYKKDGIELVLKCTDLVSYLKGMKTQRINKYKTTKTGSTGNPVDDLDRSRAAEIESLFFQKIAEEGSGGINISKVEGNKTTVTTSKGKTKVGIKNPTTGKFKSQVPPKKTWQGGFQKRVRNDKDIENNALKNPANQTYNKLLEINLRYQNKLNQFENGSIPDEDGPKIADSTDNNLELKARIFGQPIFKQFTYYGGSGELLSFKANTDTRKTKENKTISSGVDPHKKKIIAVQVDTVDSKEIKTPAESKKAIREGLAQKIPQGEYSEELMKQALDDYKSEFTGYKELNPDKKTTRVYKELTTNYDPGNTFMGYMAKKTSVNVYQRSAIIASPQFQNWVQGFRTPELKGYGNGGGMGIKKVLTGYSIESINRKYTGSAEVIGDPSLIKGKVYQFNNLGRLDRGKWYATSVEHKIDMDSGYTCSLTLMKNPKPIGISSKTYSANPKFDRATGDINIEEEVDIQEAMIYESKNQEKEYLVSDIDKVEQENQYREEDIVTQMDGRLDFLKAEDDNFNNLVENDEFLIEETQLFDKPKPNAHNS